MRSHRDLFTRVVLSLVAAAAIIAGAAATAGASSPPVAVYHSPSGDGTAPATPPAIPGEGVTALHLYVDGGMTPAPFAACEADPGDDLCAYTLDVTAFGDVTLQAFLPAGSTL